MRAILSGQMGLALLLGDHGQCWLMRVDRPALEPSRIQVYPGIFAAANDLQFRDNIKEAQLRTELEQSWRQERALFLAHLLLDKDFSAATLRTVAQELAKFEDVLAYVRATLYLCPAPQDADFAGAVQACSAWPALRDLFAGLQRDQVVIAELAQAWTQAMTRPTDPALLQEARAQGWFTTLAKIHGNAKAIADWRFSVPQWSGRLQPWLVQLSGHKDRPLRKASAARRQMEIKHLHPHRYNEIHQMLLEAVTQSQDAHVFFDLEEGEDAAQLCNDFNLVAQKEGLNLIVRRVRGKASLMFKFTEEDSKKPDQFKERILEILSSKRAIQKSEDASSINKDGRPGLNRKTAPKQSTNKI